MTAMVPFRSGGTPGMRAIYCAPALNIAAYPARLIAAGSSEAKPLASVTPGKVILIGPLKLVSIDELETLDGEADDIAEKPAPLCQAGYWAKPRASERFG